MNKKFFFAAPLLGASFAIAAGLSSCSNDSALALGSASIKSIEIGTSLKTSEKAYSFVEDKDSCYLTKSVSVEWPVKVGAANLTPLQDSILAIAFDKPSTEVIDDAITSYLDDYSTVAESATAINPAQVPLSTRAYTMKVSVKTLETTPLYLSTQIVSSSYLGGAHPNTAIRPMTIALDSAKVITVDNLFKPSALEHVRELVKENLGRQLNVSGDRLTDAGLFTNDIPLSQSVYIINSTIVFHYGQYEIAPYSMGMFDVDVYPFTVRDWLTPLGQSLFPGQLD